MEEYMSVEAIVRITKCSAQVCIAIARPIPKFTGRSGHFSLIYLPIDKHFNHHPYCHLSVFFQATKV